MKKNQIEILLAQAQQMEREYKERIRLSDPWSNTWGYGKLEGIQMIVGLIERHHKRVKDGEI